MKHGEVITATVTYRYQIDGKTDTDSEGLRLYLLENGFPQVLLSEDCDGTSRWALEFTSVEGA